MANLLHTEVNTKKVLAVMVVLNSLQPEFVSAVELVCLFAAG